MKGLIKLGIVETWSRTATHRSTKTGRLYHTCRATLTEKGRAAARVARMFCKADAAGEVAPEPAGNR